MVAEAALSSAFAARRYDGYPPTKTRPISVKVERAEGSDGSGRHGASEAIEKRRHEGEAIHDTMRHLLAISC